jgi:hypothetical protein
LAVSQREVLFEGLSEKQILALPHEHVEKLILLGEPLVFQPDQQSFSGLSKSRPVVWWSNLRRLREAVRAFSFLT